MKKAYASQKFKLCKRNVDLDKNTRCFFS